MGVRLYLSAMNLVAKINSQPDELLGPRPWKSPPETNAATFKRDGFETVLNNNATCSIQTAVNPPAAWLVTPVGFRPWMKRPGRAAHLSPSSAEVMVPYMPSWRSKAQIFVCMFPYYGL